MKLASGKYDQDDCRNRAFDHLRDKSAGRSSDLTTERALKNFIAEFVSSHVIPCRLAYGCEKFRTASCGDHQKVLSLNILAEHRGTFP